MGYMLRWRENSTAFPVSKFLSLHAIPLPIRPLPAARTGPPGTASSSGETEEPALPPPRHLSRTRIRLPRNLDPRRAFTRPRAGSTTPIASRFLAEKISSPLPTAANSITCANTSPHSAPVSHIPHNFPQLPAPESLQSRPAIPLPTTAEQAYPRSMKQDAHPSASGSRIFDALPPFSTVLSCGLPSCVLFRPLNTTSCGSLLTSTTNRATFPHAALFCESHRPQEKRHTRARQDRTLIFFSLAQT